MTRTAKRTRIVRRNVDRVPDIDPEYLGAELALGRS
jgi:hypothetical protein